MKFIRYIFYYIYKLLKTSHNYIMYEKYRKKYNIDETVRFNGSGIIMNGEGEIIIGKGSYIGDSSSIQSVHGMRVVIGDNCAISHNVRIYTSNYDANEIIFENTKLKTKNGDVIIGSNCWICANVLITEGVTIGANVVIGANSVVTNDIPSNCLIGGVPARVIKANDLKK